MKYWPSHFYLCTLVTTAIFRVDIALLIVRLCCGQAGGPAGGETGWLFHLKVQSVCVCCSLYLQSCWYKEPCVKQWCDVWICLGRGCQLCLGMAECVCVYVHMCIGGGRVEWARVWGSEMSLGRALWEKEWLEAYLDLIPDRGVQFMAPGCITPSGALFRWLYCYESLLTLQFNILTF